MHSPTSADLAPALDDLANHFVAGLVVLDVDWTGVGLAGFEPLLADQAMPAVVVSQRAPAHGAFDCVTWSNADAAEIATRHLLDLGHRHLAYLGRASVPRAPTDAQPCGSCQTAR